MPEKIFKLIGIVGFLGFTLTYFTVILRDGWKEKKLPRRLYVPSTMLFFLPPNYRAGLEAENLRKKKKMDWATRSERPVEYWLGMIVYTLFSLCAAYFLYRLLMSFA